MIRLIQRRLIIPRGDTGTFTIPVVASNNTGDVAVFTIFSEMTKKKIYEKIVAIDSDTITVEFAHGDTVNLPVGKYVWDIKFYKNPVFVDDVLVNGDEIDSYYAAFTLPVCEIRQTGDTLLTADDAPTATIAPEYLNIVNAAISETLHNKNLAAESAAAAETSAANASSYLTDTLAAKDVAEARVNEIENLSVEVNTGAEGSDASVTYTPATGVLSFEIPRGDTGNGIASCVLNADFTLTINYTDGTSLTTIPIRGDTPHLTIGEVTEGPNAIATITGTDANPILNLTLPNANVPTRVSQLENDSGYLTEHQDLSDYVQKTDYATKSTAGIVKVAGLGVKMDNDELTLAPASPRQIKQGTGDTAPIVAAKEHESTFYGLAKAAGDTTQGQSSNAVGTYTDEAKTAIQQMLDVPANADIPTQVSQLTNDAGYLTSFTETDPTVPAWAKAAQKPSYTAAEVGAPTVQEMNSAISTAIGNINSFDMAVVQELPTTDISTHTIYLVPKTGETNDVYDEYVYINNAWEMVGNTQVDLSDYALKSELPEVPVQDVQVNGTSILENGVANMPKATTSTGGLGVIQPYVNSFNVDANGQLTMLFAQNSHLKGGDNSFRPINTASQDKATFYGLAKAAGADMKNIANTTVGTYPDAQKEAIQSMLGITQMLAPTNPNLVASQPYAIGDVFAANGHLYKATTAIAQDGAIIPDTNCVETTMAEAGGKIKDVQVNSASVVGSDGIADIPVATKYNNGGRLGVVSIGQGLMIQSSGMLYTDYAKATDIKTGANYYMPITPVNQHNTVFYGLSKVAGVDLANETVTLGEYPDAAKTAIKNMIGVEEGLKVVRLI